VTKWLHIITSRDISFFSEPNWTTFVKEVFWLEAWFRLWHNELLWPNDCILLTSDDISFWLEARFRLWPNEHLWLNDCILLTSGDISFFTEPNWTTFVKRSFFVWKHCLGCDKMNICDKMHIINFLYQWTKLNNFCKLSF
jgi:hypothetical protein